MKRYGRVILGSLIVVGAVAAGIGPLLTGLMFQKEYLQLVDFCNSQPGVKVDITHYDKGWFRSNISLSVTIDNSYLRPTFALVGIEQKSLPTSFIFTVQQRVQHGPFIYHHLSSLPYPFGLAAIHNQIFVAPQTKAFFDAEGVSDVALSNHNDFVTFTGRYFKHFNLHHLTMHFPDKMQLQLKNMEVSLWVRPLQPRISANIQANDFLFSQDKNSLFIPSIKAQLVQYKNAFGLWLGNGESVISQMDWHWEGLPRVSISNMKLSGSLEENNGKLKGSRQLSFDKIKIDDETMGPLDLQITLRDINAENLMKIFSTYREIKERGEYYQTELKNRISELIPQLINPGTLIKLNKLHFVTAQGALDMTAQIAWPVRDFAVQDNITDTLDVSNMQASLNVSKKLTDRLLSWASTMPYFQTDASSAENPEVMALEADTTIALQQNALLLAQLVNERKIPDPIAGDLSEIQKIDPTGEIYLARVKELYLTKVITQEVAYMLYIEYANVLQHVVTLVQALEDPRYGTLMQLQAQLQEWIKEGFISERGDNYFVTITRNQGVLKVNGQGV